MPAAGREPATVGIKGQPDALTAAWSTALISADSADSHSCFTGAARCDADRLRTGCGLSGRGPITRLMTAQIPCTSAPR